MFYEIVKAWFFIVLGGITTWFASRHYYIKAAVDMEKQNTAARLVTNTMAVFLEKHLGGGKTFFLRDKEDNIIGLHHHCTDEAIISTVCKVEKTEIR